MLKRIIGLIFLMVFAGCGPTPNPELVSKINSLYPAPSSQSYRGSDTYTPVPFAVGQYVLHGNTEGDKRSVSRTAIVDKQGNGWILETHTIEPTAESLTQMLVVGLEDMKTAEDWERLDIIWVKIRNPETGQIDTIEGPILNLAKGMYKKGLKSFDFSTASGNGETVSVPAGTFANAHPMETEVSFIGMKFKARTWLHSKVPVNGMVKSIAENGKIVTELLEFGTDAKPML